MAPRPTRTARRLGAGVCLVLLAVLLVPVTSVAAAPPPSVRLIAPSKVTLHQWDDRLHLDLGVLVAAHGGEFRIEARRDTYTTPIAAAQVDPATGDVLRTVPTELLAGWTGLRRFFWVDIRDGSGRVVRTKRLDWCPNSWEGQRVDDTGPEIQTYPFMCGSEFPFTKGMVWGIDAGWANFGLGNFWDEGASVKRLPPGQYEVTVRIRTPHAKVFGIPKDKRLVTFPATVVDGEPWEHDGHGHDVALGLQQHAAVTGGPTSPAQRSMALAEILGDGATAGSGDDVPDHPLEPGLATDPRDVPASSAAAAVASPDPSTLPDLVALPAWNITMRTTRAGKELLEFATTPWNAGPAPFVIEGFRRQGTDIMDAYQYFFDAGGKVVGRAPAGKLNYHRKRGHDHWHFLHFAQFDLLDGTQEHVVKSRKQGFCLMPTDAVDLTVERATLRPDGQGRGTVCGGEHAIWVREVLEAGWGDTYYQSVAGQAFDVTGLPNGRYFIRVKVNPLGNVQQTRTDNDEALREVRLGGRPGNRSVRVIPYQGIEG